MFKKQKLSYGHAGYGVSLCLIAAASPEAFANPQVGHVVGGNASIQYGETTIINQTSHRAVIHWKDFSVDAHETTRFVVPDSRSATLNRVTGNNMSQIMGKLSSNGQIFLVNPNGIVFGKNAKVDAAGLIASTADIHDNDFMLGHYRFQEAPAGSVVINEGTITIQNAGLAALVAPHVENRGIIQAQLGKVVLASGTAFTIDLYGDNLITFDASVHQGVVENIGRIEANGGTVMLSVAAAEGIVENVVNTSGYISAKSVSNQNGNIVLQGYDRSTIKVSGTADVSGKQAGEIGGVIQVSGDAIQLLSGSFLDASGHTRGGDVHIGSDVFHHPSENHSINTLGVTAGLRTAQFVYANEEAIIHADSLNSGKAGNVVVWGDRGTWFYGNISAAAKGSLGDGGRIETSGKYLDVSGIKVDARSFYGKSGVWLLDPINITISNSASINGSFAGNPEIYHPNNMTSPSNIYYADIQTILAGGTSVIINTSLGSISGNEGDITFANTTPISWGTDASFTALANRNIIFATAGGNALNNTGAGTINLRADSDATLSGGSYGTVIFTSGRINSSGSGFVNIYYNPIAFTSTRNPYNAKITGNATVRQYMLVYNASNQAGHDLNTIASNTSTWNRSYALAENITPFTLTAPIGNSTTRFSGIFNGNDYTISGLTLSSSARYVGLFGNVAGASAQLHDITLISPNVTSSYASTNGAVGAIAGIVQSGATLTGDFEVRAEGVTTVEGLRNVGGLFGVLGAAAKISTGSTFATTVNSGAFTVSNLSVSGVNVGGLFGSVAITSASGGLFNAATLINNATVIADAKMTGIGGIFGTWSGSGSTINATMTNNGIVSLTAGTATSVGGIGGNVSGNNTFTGSMMNSANIRGSTSVGGLFGTITAGSYAGAMTSSGHVTATGSTVGGLIGSFSGTTSVITNTTNDFKTTAAITVSGISSVGGLVGSFGASAIFARETNVSNVAGSIVRGSGSNIGGLFGTLTSTVTAGTNFASSPATSFTNYADIQVTGPGTHTGVAGVIGNFAKAGLTVAANMENFGHITFSGTASSSTGGVIGAIVNNTLTGNLFNAGNIAGSSSLGGVIGAVSAGIYSGNIENTGDVTGTTSIGGLLGAVTGGEFSGMMQSSGDVSGTGNTVGGLIGTFSGATAAITGSQLFRLSGPVTVSGVSNVGGLFGSFGANAVFSRNIALETPMGTVVIGSNDNIGGLFGILSGAISGANNFSPASLTNHANIQVTGATAHNYVGGVFGRISKIGLTINADMENTGDLTFTATAPVGIGGIAGGFSNNTFNGNMLNSGDIRGGGSLGGLVGIVAGNALFSGSMINSGAVIGTGDNVGGLVGSTTSAAATFKGSSIATVVGANSVGGLIGSMIGGSITQSYFSGTVAGNGSVGGIVGTLFSGTVNEVYNINTTVRGTSNVGGMVGNNVAGLISNVLFGGIVDFTGTNAGGIVGFNTGTISTSLSIGSIKGVGTIRGGIVGDNTLGTITNTFYSINTYFGLGAVGTGPVGTSKTGDYNTLGLASTFTPFGWAFPGIWQQTANRYVSLAWCGSACAVVNPGYPSIYIPLDQYSVVERMLNQTEMIQYENDTDFHTYLAGIFIQSVSLPGFGFDVKVVATEEHKVFTPLELAIKALNFLSLKQVAIPASPSLPRQMASSEPQ